MYFINHNSICICERLMSYSVPSQCGLEGGPLIGGPCLKPADPSISSSGTARRMVVLIDTSDPGEQCHKVNIESS